MYQMRIDRPAAELGLTNLGFRYEPDRMGRINRGRWRAPDGFVIEGTELDELDGAVIPVAGKSPTGAPRGMNNPTVREAARFGRRFHDFMDQWAKSKGWEYNKGVHEKATSRYPRPDIRIPRGKGKPDYYIEIKPDTPNGRRKARQQVGRYRNLPGPGEDRLRVRALFYRRLPGGGFHLRAPMSKGMRFRPPNWLQLP